MDFQRIRFLLARAYFGLFILLTSFYCLLSYIPFSYHWFIKFSPVAWLPFFARFHPYFFLSAIAAVSLTLGRALRETATRRIALGFVTFNLLAAALLIVHPFLRDVPNDYRAFVWSLVALYPLVWLALIDFAVPAFAHSQPMLEPETFSPLPCVFAALFVSTIYSSAAFLHFATSTAAGAVRPGIFPIAWNAVSILVVMVAVFVAFETVRLLAAWILPLRSAPTSLAVSVVAAILIGILLRKLVLSTLGFNHWWATVYAATLAVVTVLAVQGMRRQLAAETQTYGIRRAPMKGLFLGIGLLAIIAVVFFAQVVIGKYDWNFLLKKLVAAGVWMAALLLFYRAFGSRRRSHSLRIHVLTLAVLAGMCFGGYRLLAHPVAEAHSDALELYAGYDTSFKLARDVLSPSLDDESYRAFYTFLQRNTSLPESVQVQPVPIRLVEELKPVPGPHPHIFFFIVDSLRQDYLSPYNSQVDFTPNISSFAGESVVFHRAFTRYGGTVLSIPAIWTGSMQLHKQYIEPFYPMAELQKLVQADGYQRWITMDPVIKLLLRPDPQVEELDRDASYWTEYDLNKTLKEVEDRMDSRGAAKPIFVYSQAHNTHTATLSLLAKTRPPKRHYPGFNDQYAAEVDRMDQGFGEFVAFLKKRGLYDNSIIILTSDHGDSLGEFGRWGHSSTMFPEVVRIPLIIHLPAAMQKMYCDPDAVAFSMDVTPSLFYLLGHRPIRNDEVLGRPLFTDTRQEHDAYLRDAYLLVSSYGPVYARLSDHGNSLFIVDAAAHQNFLYDLADDPQGLHNRLTLRAFPPNESFIRHRVEEIDRFFHFPEGLARPEDR